MPKQNRIPLTPAEQMQYIREAVLAAEAEDSDAAYALLALYLFQQNRLRGCLNDLERKMVLRERPFTSHVPLFGPLIVRIRTLWNWMSTRWYVLPLIQQQNEFNRAVVQALNEMLTILESLTRTVSSKQDRAESPPTVRQE